MPERPYVLVGQQYLADPSRSNGDVHPVWSYAHVPNGFTGDATETVIDQIERFAPGLRERIVGTSVRPTMEFPDYNANYVGGDIITGANTPVQVLIRPRFALDPYSCGADGLFMCSAATPPGAGVHGMNGFNAAQSVLGKWDDGGRGTCTSPAEDFAALQPQHLRPDRPRRRVAPDPARDDRLVRGARQGRAEARRPRARVVLGLPRLRQARAGLLHAPDARRATADGDAEKRWDTTRICHFNEITGFYGLAYWYTWQVSILGLGPIWQSENEAAQASARAKLLDDGAIFAFGLSEREHGADIYSTDMVLTPGRRRRLPRRTAASTTSATATRPGWSRCSAAATDVEGPDGYVFFAADSQHANYELVQNVVNAQMYVSEFRLRRLPGERRGRPAHRARRLRGRAQHGQHRQVQPRLRLDRDLRARLLRGDHPRRQPRPLRQVGHRVPARAPGRSSTPTRAWSR